MVFLSILKLSNVSYLMICKGVVLMGGSTDVDSAFAWMCTKAGGGDWLVLRTTG